MSASNQISRWAELEPTHNYRPELGDYEPAMGFEEIARQLGTDRQHVWFWYCSAIKKLRRDPESLLKLLSIADALARERDRREA